MDRRKFLQSSLAGAAAGSLLGGTERPARAAAGGSTQPRRVIFLVSDGMSQAVPSLTEAFSLQTRAKPTAFTELLRDPSLAHGLFETHSLSSLVTDSAAAATAWGAGSRVANGAINMLPDDTKLTPIHRLLKAEGFGTGLVTTSRVTHATPAGFAAVQANRNDEDEIAPQYRGVVDVVLGGGARHFDPKDRRDGRDILAAYAEAGYTLCRSRKELLGAPIGEGLLLGCFSDSHIPYLIDRGNQKERFAEVPGLAEMTRAALERLDANPRGFLLQVEGARIDHAAHMNDAACMLWEQIDFDEAIVAALEYQRERPDTLVIVTSDHGNSNPGLNGMGRSYNDSTESFRRLAGAKASFAELDDRLEARLETAGKVETDDVSEALGEGLGLEITREEAEAVLLAFQGNEPAELNPQHRNLVGILGQVAGRHTGVFWTGTTHTEDYVLLAAKGPGQDAWRGLLRNTDCFDIVSDYYGLTHKNPRADEAMAAEARRRERALAEVDVETPAHWA